MIPLNKRNCTGHEELRLLSKEEIDEFAKELNVKWGVGDKKLKREFEFEDFKQAIQFVNKVADLAEEQNHHPDIRLFGYNNVEIELSTHAVEGLSENDFIMAAKIDNM